MNDRVEFDLNFPCPICKSLDAGRLVGQRCQSNHFVAEMFRDEAGQIMLKVGCQTHSVARWLEVAEGEEDGSDLALELRDLRHFDEFPAAIATVKEQAKRFAELQISAA